MFTRLIPPILAFALLFSASAAKPAKAAQPKPPIQEMTPDNLEAFIDRYIAEHMADAHAPGLVVTIVANGETVFSKGYGEADLDAGLPFTTDTPLRAGSVSKTLTSAAVLRLVDAGRIDLDAPISDYLPGISFDDGYGPASTVSQLLSLQGGYPEVLIGTHSPDFEGWMPLEEYLTANLPGRVLRPGTAYSYNSWEHGLLGAALGAVSGTTFDQAIAEVLLAPLGMARSTFTQPIPDAILADLAQGYGYRNGAYDPVPLDYVNLSPGIALITTGEDMGRFMAALLEDENRFLSAEAHAGLFTRQNEVHPYSRARSFGLSEATFGGRAVLYQDGNGIGFANRLVFVPEQGFGMFISTNHRALGPDLGSTSANDFIRGLSAAVLENFLPETAAEYPAGTPLANAAERAPRYAGHYALAGTSQTDMFKVGALLDYADVSDNGDGTIRIGSRDYVEVEPDVFRTIAEPYYYVVFTEGPGGEIENVAFGGTGTYAKVRWYEGFKFQAALAGAIALITLVTVVVWPFTRHAPFMLWIAALLQLLFLAGFGLMMVRGDLLQLFKGVDLKTQALLLIPWIHAAAAAVGIAGLFRSPERLGAGLLPALAAVAFTWFALYWRLFL